MISILGCGPYGLSLASYLQRLGIEYRIFGDPMSTWKQTMFEDVLMRSHISLSCPENPAGLGLLENWLRQHAPGGPIPEPHAHLRLNTRTFLQFIEHFIASSQISRRDFGVRATRLRALGPKNYEVELSDGTAAYSDTVVVATGLQGAQRLPDWAAPLPPSSVIHSNQLRAHTVNADARYLVIGGAQSAAEAVAHLLDHGCRGLSWAARREALNWNSVHLAATPERWAKMLHLRRVFPFCSAAYRHAHFDNLLPPSIEPELSYLADQVRLLNEHEVEWVRPSGLNALEVTFRSGERLVVDHIIACTGYQPTLRNLPFDAAALAGQLQTHKGLPELSEHAESSAAGLFFSGALSALRFGPQSNFIFGTEAITRAVIARLLQV